MAYFDHNATTPLSAPAKAALLDALEGAWQNPSSPCRESARVRNLLEETRERLGGLLGCAPERIVFNSGATEGNNAVLAWAARRETSGRDAVLSAVEHPCVLEPGRYFFSSRLHVLPVDESGRLTGEELDSCLERLGGAAIVSVMAANNETGVLQRWDELAEVCRRRRVPFHCDAAQWIGKLPASGLAACDFVTGSAHKMGGPKGVGFLVLPRDAGSFQSQLGGHQENGHRGGTENYPAVAAMEAALSWAEEEGAGTIGERESWRRRFEETVLAAIPGARVNGQGAPRLWNTVSLVLPGPENIRWVTRLDREGFCVSTGSACATGDESPSHVLSAMGLPREQIQRTLRISSGWGTTETDWQRLGETLVKIHHDGFDSGSGPSLTEVISID